MRHLIRPWAKPLLLLLLVSLLGGCDRSDPESMLDNYAHRVGNVIDETIDPDFHIAARIPLFPTRRDRLLPLTDLREGLLDVLALRHCDLLHLIAERNSSLGKVMPPSQQLAYELRFMAPLRACRARLLASPDSDPDLLHQVNAIYRVKTRDLPAVLWNAIYASPEMEANFSRGDPPLPLKDDGTADAALASLQQLADLVELTQKPDWQLPELAGHIESPYQVLNANHFGSQWLKSLVLLTETLQQTAQAIERREKRYPLCLQHRPTPKAKILLNVFTLFYAGEVQPYLARVDREGRRWRDLHGQLLAELPATPAMKHYYRAVFAADNPDSLWQRYIRARDRHTHAWQAVLRRCDLMPGSDR